MNVGEIELQLRYWLVDTNSKTPRIPSRGKSSPVERVFNEKAKKGIDHQTTCVTIFHERCRVSHELCLLVLAMLSIAAANIKHRESPMARVFSTSTSDTGL